MPLIWDNKEYRWIDEDEEYDKSTFVRVRKLFAEFHPKSPVSLPKAATDGREISFEHIKFQRITWDDVSGIFRKYGSIETIDLQNSNGWYWAHITFQQESEASFALFGEKCNKHKHVSKLLPAHTWKQPSSAASAELGGNMASMSSLNDDCFRQILKSCDLYARAALWQVCKRWRAVVEETHPKFLNENFKKYELNFDGIQRKSLEQVRTELQYGGKYILTLRVRYKGTTGESTVYEMCRYLQQCNKYLTSLRRLEMDKLPVKIFSGKYVRFIQSLLLQVEEIQIIGDKNRSYFGSPFDVHLPNVEALYLETEGHGIDGAVDLLRKTYPRLRLLHVSFLVSERFYESFLQRHTQIKSLRVQAKSLDEVVKPIVKHLSVLKELMIDCSKTRNLSRNILMQLHANEELRNLHLEGIHADVFRPYLENIVDNLGNLPRLRSLRLTKQSDDDLELSRIQLVQLCRRLSDLEHFCTDLASKQDKIVLLVQNARRLRTFCAPRIRGTVTLEFIQRIVEARRSLFEVTPDEITVLRFYCYAAGVSVSMLFCFISSGRKFRFCYLFLSQLKLEPEMAEYVALAD